MSSKQLDLFRQPSFSFIVQDVKSAMNEAVKNSNLSREQVLDRMNVLSQRFGVRLINGNGKALTMETLNKWLNVEDEIRMPSIKALPIFCAAVGCSEPVEVMARLLGAMLIDDSEIKLLKWARRYHKAKGLRKEMKELEAEIS